MYFDLRAPLPKNLRPFENQLTSIFTTCYYWGARQTRNVRLIQFALDEALRDFLTARPHLTDWNNPPPGIMDPHLYGADEIPLLWTIAHEDLVFFWMNEEEAREFQDQGMPLIPATDVEPPIVQKDVVCTKRGFDDRLILFIIGIIALAFLGMTFFMAEGFLRLAGLL